MSKRISAPGPQSGAKRLRLSSLNLSHQSQAVANTSFLVGRASYKYIKGPVLKSPRVVKGRWFPFQSHVSSIFSHHESSVNKQSMYAYPLLDLNILNKLYSFRYMQNMQASYDGSAWSVGPTYHWLLRANGSVLKEGVGFGLFNPGTNSGLSMANSGLDRSWIPQIGRIMGPTGSSPDFFMSNEQKLVYLRGVYLAGSVKTMVTLRNNGIRPTYIDMYEVLAREWESPALTSSLPWWSTGLMLSRLQQTAYTTFSENDWEPYSHVATDTANTNDPVDKLYSGDMWNSLEFDLKNCSTDSPFGVSYKVWGHRHIVLAPGQQVTVPLGKRNWYIDLYKFHTMAFRRNLYPADTSQLPFYWTNCQVAGLNYGVLFRQKGGIAHQEPDGDTPPTKQFNVGVDDSEVDIKIDQKYSWSFKCDDGISFPTRGVVHGTITEPLIVVPNAVQES